MENSGEHVMIHGIDHSNITDAAAMVAKYRRTLKTLVLVPSKYSIDSLEMGVSNCCGRWLDGDEPRWILYYNNELRTAVATCASLELLVVADNTIGPDDNIETAATVVYPTKSELRRAVIVPDGTMVNELAASVVTARTMAAVNTLIATIAARDEESNAVGPYSE